MKSKITEIKNRVAHIQDLLVDLSEVIKEVEVDDVINTSKAQQKRFEDGVFLAGSTVNELEDYEEEVECKSYCVHKAIGVAAVILLAVYIFSNL